MSLSHRNWVLGARCAVIAAAFACTQGAGAAQSAYKALVTAKNPLTYFMLDDAPGSTTVADSGTNGTPTPGTIGVGATLGQPSAGAVLNTALTYSGAAQPVAVTATDPKFDNIGTGDFTVEMWFNTANITTREDLFNFKGTTGSDLGIQLSTNTADRLAIYHNGFTIDSTTPVTPNVWHHLALTRVGLGGAETLYLDGVPVGSATDTLTVSTAGTGVLAVGSKSFGSNFRSFSGSLDEFALYNTALTPPKCSPTPPPSPNPRPPAYCSRPRWLC